MKRLREQSSSPDPAVARAAAILGAVRPLDTAQIRRSPLPFSGNARPRAVPMRVALVLAVSLASAVAGAATIHRVAWLRTFTEWRASASQPPMSPASSPAPVAHAPPAAPTAAASAVDVTDLPMVAARPPLAHPPAALGARPSPRPSSAAADESALMVDAVRALRRDRDPRRAETLAQEALQRYPHGAQVEEATAVAMEAASAAGDATAARAWAERYLAAFPAGRFADRARQVLAPPER